MPQVNIPEPLFAEIERAVLAPASPEEFVLDAVREKLSWKGRKLEFFRLSDETRSAMVAKGLEEADILSDFEAFRNRLSEHDRA